MSDKPTYEELAQRVKELERFSTRFEAVEKEKKQLQAKLLQVQKLEALGALAGTVAHDFNNLFGIILGNVDLAMEDIPSWSEAYSNLNEVKQASLRARSIIGQILAFSRQKEELFKPVRIGSVVEESLMMIRASIPTTIEVRPKTSEVIGVINADEFQINQILISLCINAAYVMQGAGGFIEIILKDMSIDDSTPSIPPGLIPGSYVRLTINSISNEAKSDTIDPFFVPFSTEQDMDRKAGVGLGAIQEMVKKHGGVITVDRHAVGGSTFHIWFPVIDDKAGLEEEIATEPPKGNEKILFVDDEEAFVKVAKKMLERLGYEVRTMNSPLDALEIFQARPHGFDMVITDMTMPQMTGFTFTEKVKQIKPEIPIIMCSGHSDFIDKKTGRKIGISAFVQKPVAKSDLGMLVRRVLDEKG
jgi:CheY-like chemotaxis protein/signal transduction histidine kinase